MDILIYDLETGEIISREFTSSDDFDEEFFVPKFYKCLYCKKSSKASNVESHKTLEEEIQGAKVRLAVSLTKEEKMKCPHCKSIKLTKEKKHGVYHVKPEDNDISIFETDIRTGKTKFKIDLKTKTIKQNDK